MTFTITVNPPLSFGDLFGLFNNGAGKANPAQESVDGVLQIVVGQPYSLTLPAVEGGTPPYTYSLTGLPAGLSFDPDTRTVSGTPTTLSETVVVTYMVTDGSGASQFAADLGGGRRASAGCARRVGGLRLQGC